MASLAGIIWIASIVTTIYVGLSKKRIGWTILLGFLSLVTWFAPLIMIFFIEDRSSKIKVKKAEKPPMPPALEQALISDPQWYPDPEGRFFQRYHNGQEWTDWVSGSDQKMFKDPFDKV